MVKASLGISVIAMLFASGCGPSLSSLVRDRHYREAVCAVSGGDDAAVMDALVADANVRVRAHRLSSAELSAIDPRAAEAIAPRASIVVVALDGRRMPIDELTAEISFRSEGETAATGATRSALIWATSETEPRATAVETRATGLNALLALGYIVTAGLPLLFGSIAAAATGTSFDPMPDRGLVAIEAPESEYERLAPVATALYRGLPVCDSRMGPMLRCSGALLVDPALRGGTVHVTVRAASRRVARSGEPLDEWCVATRDYAVEWTSVASDLGEASLAP